MMYPLENVVLCPEHELIDIESLYEWMGSDYIFYYSCDNCTKCNKCNRFSHPKDKKH